MKTSFLHSRYFNWINLPGAILMMLLQRMPAIGVAVAGDEMVIASPVGTVLKSVAVVVAALGAVNTVVGATPLVPSAGSATGISVTTGTAVSVFYTVNGTQTPPASWTIAGNIPPGLDFSGLTSPGTVNISSLHLEGTPTMAGTFNLTLQTFEFASGGGVASPVYNYTITVTGGSGSMNVAPSFTTQPSSQTVSAGASVMFSAVVSGTPTPTYQWRKGGTNIGGATSSSFSIASVAASDAGDYTVVATNSQGSTTSNIATLTVSAANVAPTFTTQPAGQTVAPGASVSFSAAASGTPAPTYQWRKGGTNIAGATSSSFSIASVAASDAGDYTVVATNSQGSTTSNIATLTVSAANVAPTFTTQPAGQTVAPGASVMFSAAASGTPAPTYQWRKGGTNIAGATSSSFSIASVAASDAGDYTVVATNSQGSATSNIATLTVSAANLAPTFTTQPASQTAAPGASIMFSAAASGTPTPTYQWRKGGTNIAGATSSSFSIASVAASDAGDYTVVASNSQGSVTSNIATLTITTATSSQPSSATVATGHSVSFSAGNTAGVIQWQVSTDNGSTWTNLGNNGTYSGATSSTLMVSNADATLNGAQYRFQATNNGVVSVSNPATLAVAAALFPFPTGLALDLTGNIFVTDSNTNTVRKIDSQGMVSLIAGTSGTAGSTDGIGSAARFNMPGGIALDLSGNIFVADTANATIRRIAPDGTVTTFAGSANNRGSTDGVGTAAMFSAPVGVAVDGSGNVFVADSMNDTIRKISSTGTVSTFAGAPGVTGSADGNGSAARFNLPTGLAIDSAGNLYVSDTTNNTIRKITSAGNVSTLAGLAGVSGSQDGTRGSAFFNRPGGLALDASGNLYVADTGNSVIRKVNAAGAVSTIAGLDGIAGLMDGPASDAFFNQPQALDIDSTGTLDVADTGNAAIRKISPSEMVTTPALATAPSGGGAGSGGMGGGSGGGAMPPTSTMPSGGGGGGEFGAWFTVALGLLTFLRLHRKAR